MPRLAVRCTHRGQARRGRMSAGERAQARSGVCHRLSKAEIPSPDAHRGGRDERQVTGSPLYSDGGKLRFALELARQRTFARDGPDLDAYTVRQAWAFLRDRHRFIETGDVEQKVAGDRFL